MISTGQPGFGQDGRYYHLGGYIELLQPAKAEGTYLSFAGKNKADNGAGQEAAAGAVEGS